jgi:hypothetical protein
VPAIWPLAAAETSSPAEIPVVLPAGGWAPPELGGAVSVSPAPIAVGDPAACCRVRVDPPAWDT